MGNSDTKTIAAWSPGPVHEAVMDALLEGKTDVEAAEAAGVKLETVRRWQRNPVFMAEMTRRVGDRWNVTRGRLMATAAQAVEVLSEGVEAGDLKAAALVLRNLKTVLELKPAVESGDPLVVLTWRAERLADAELRAEGADMNERLLFRESRAGVELNKLTAETLAELEP